MALVATVTLRRGRYDAGGRDDRLPELIPSPFRLLCALVAVAARSGAPGDRTGLRWLEDQPAPTILRPPVLDQRSEEAFFVTNRVAAARGSMTHPGRVNVSKHRAWVSFRGDQFRFVWEAEPDTEVLDDLRSLARGVGYVGRVESTATVSFSVEADVDPGGGPIERFEPVPIDHEGDAVAVGYPGVVDELIAAHDRGASAWEVARWAQYASPSAPRTTVERGPFESLVVFRIVGRAVDGSHLLDLTSALRSAVMSRVEALVGHEHLVPAVHGHDLTITHLAYLALPFVDHPHADGSIRGLAVGLPRSLEGTDRAVVLQALTGATPDEFRSIPYGRGRSEGDGTSNRRIEIEHVPFADGAAVALRPARWEGPVGGARTWVTATPAMLDRFPKKGATQGDVIADGLIAAGFPAPASVEVGPSASLVGSPTYRSSGMVFKRRHRRPLVHARITFPMPVTGPVVVGALRYLGGGLCLPLRGKPDTVRSAATETAVEQVSP